jgi:hypothetical protein
MKLSPLTILLCGVAIAIVALSWAFFQEYRPNNEDAANWREQASLLESEANQLSRAKKRKEQAEEMVEAKAAQWRQIVATKTPPSSLAGGGIDLSVNGWQLTVDAPKFRNNVQRLVNAQVRAGGVAVINGPAIPPPDQQASSILASYFNYPAFAYPIVIWDLGQVTVRGTYKQITENVRAWSRMPRFLAVADGLQLTGTSPMLTGTYNLSIVGFMRGKEFFPPVPEGGAPSQGQPAPGTSAPSGPRSGGGATAI